ncbi:MAG: tyrosine-type recombinase/integrase [Solirubrobacterales bacterium]
MSVQVEHREKGKGRSFRLRYTDHAGKMRSETFEIKQDAQARDAEIRQAKQRREPIPKRGRGDAGETFRTFAYESWWPQHVEAQKMVAKTEERYRTFLDKHLLPRIGDDPIVYIDVPRVLEVKAGLAKDGVPNYTSARTLKLLRQILAFAQISGRLSINPADVLRAKGMLPPQGRQTDIRPLLPAEVETIRAAMLARQTPHALRDATLVSVLAYAGLRPGEALGLAWGSAGEDQLRIAQRVSGGKLLTATKTGERRTVPKLIAPVMDDLAAWHEASEHTSAKALVFPGDDGKQPWSVTTYGNFRNRAWKECAPEGTLIYGLRHGYALSLAREGVQVSDAAKRMGHKPTTHLQHYEHFLDDLREQERETMEAAVLKARSKSGQDRGSFECDTRGYAAVAQTVVSA